MGDGGACHPRDNIALRWMAEELDLGYDLFDAVMLSREVQARNMADRLAELANHGAGQTPPMPVIIVGKAYKPLVPYTAGSSSMLVGHYVTEAGTDLYYLDDSVGEYPPEHIRKLPAVYLLAHNPEITYGEQLDFVNEWYSEHTPTGSDGALTGDTLSLPAYAPGSILVDPWRKVPRDTDNAEVIHYGNTRQS
jgi:UDPglucose 6-dehydrogenase